MFTSCKCKFTNNINGVILFILEQERQCTYNVILRRVGVTIFAVEKQQALHILNVRLQP
jgi:hypothetical protein